MPIVKVISDGTSKGTQVWIDENRLVFVKSVSLLANHYRTQVSVQYYDPQQDHALQELDLNSGLTLEEEEAHEAQLARVLEAIGSEPIA